MQTLKNWYHFFVALFANSFYGFPGGKITIIGITGTDGKTTTVNLIYHILSAAGKSVSMISTVGAVIHGNRLPLGFHVTNPPSVPLQKFLHEAAKSKNEENYLVLEVSSHGIDQHRIWGIPFAIAGITNVTHEHLDYHKTYQNYVQTKTRLLNLAKTAVINADDDSFISIKKYLKKYPDEKIITYGMTKKADKTQKDFPEIHTFEERYNQYNALLAATVCSQLGISHEVIAEAFKTFSLPLGRADMVYQGNFSVMIDFAHTPNAFEELLSTLREKVKGRIIHVFGSAGERDVTKRPLMGRNSAAYADVMIITAEDPRHEPIEKITQDILSGVIEKQKKQVTILTIPSRQEAIQKAVLMARKGDFIILTGKGHEQSMNLGHGEKPWDEYKEVKEALRLRHADK